MEGVKEEVRGYSGGPGGGEKGGIAERKFFCQGRLLLSLTYSTFHSLRHTLHAHTHARRVVRRTSAFDRKVLGARIRHDSSTSTKNIQLKVKRSALEHGRKKGSHVGVEPTTL